MDYKLFAFVSFSCVVIASCRNLRGVENATSELDVAGGSWRNGRAPLNLVYVNLFTCAVRYDASCIVDAAGELFEMKKNELLAQADLEALRVTGRADPETTPSHLAKTIEQLISQLSGLFKDGISSFFGGKEADDDDEIVDPDDKDDGNSRDVGEARKKKKKKPLKTLLYLIKIGIVAAIAAGKILVLVKVFEAALKFKFLLLAAGGFIIQAIRFWFDLKAQKEQHHEENIVYRNPYEHGGDWSSAGPGGPGEYNARSYDAKTEFAQNLAFSGQKPPQATL